MTLDWYILTLVAIFILRLNQMFFRFLIPLAAIPMCRPTFAAHPASAMDIPKISELIDTLHDDVANSDTLIKKACM